MNQEFSIYERQALTPFFTSLNNPTFGLRLPQEVAGALFSRYSRSTKSLRRVFLEEFLDNPDFSATLQTVNNQPVQDQNTATKKAREFYDRVLTGYGDDSVAQLGGAHIACESVSNVAAKLLEDNRIGIAPLEKSTRYVRFDSKDWKGDYLFCREPKIMTSPHRKDYLGVMQLLFETYSAQINPMTRWVQEKMPIAEMQWKHPETEESLTYEEALKDEKLKRWIMSAHRAAVRAHTLDVLHVYLPAATLTNVGLFGSGQAFEHLLNKLYSQELIEAQHLAIKMHEALNALIPSFVKRAEFNPYLAETYAAIRSLSAQLLAKTPVFPSKAVTLIDYDEEAEEKVIATILYPHCRHPLTQLREIVKHLTSKQRGKILDEYLSRRRHRRDKPGRALEQVYYTFDILANLGIYRDLQRHRILTQERQDFTTAHGYDTPPEIKEAGFKADFDRCMEEAANLYEKIHRDLPLEAQYVVPFAYRVRWYMKLNLREAVHIGELRTTPQGHPNYRLIVQKMWKEIGRVHPTLGQVARFIDWSTYRLGRLQSEMRTEYKKSLLSSS